MNNTLRAQMIDVVRAMGEPSYVLQELVSVTGSDPDQQGWKTEWVTCANQDAPDFSKNLRVLHPQQKLRRYVTMEDWMGWPTIHVRLNEGKSMYLVQHRHDVGFDVIEAKNCLDPYSSLRLKRYDWKNPWYEQWSFDGGKTWNRFIIEEIPAAPFEAARFTPQPKE